MASAVVPHITVEVAVKFVPLMVSVKSLLPANAEVGDSEEMVGAGPTESEKPSGDALAIFVFAEGDSADAIAAQAKTRIAATITCNQRLNQRVLCISAPSL